MDFKPSYVWPNPAFPFRIYYDGPECRVFIIENIQHNWSWLSKYHDKFRETDCFFVLCGWYFSKDFANEAEMIFSLLQIDKQSFYFLFNSKTEVQNAAPYGFMGDVINQNAWLDQSLFPRLDGNPVEKLYDAIYVARLSAFKRHYLADKVGNLALVAGINHGNPVVEHIPPHTYRNEKPLKPDEVFAKIRQARCGLILSETEGACFASSEYLLCGIPVVSTPSFGGRDVWYNDYNSIICDPNPDSVAEAVRHFFDNPRDPQKIYVEHHRLAVSHRRKFIKQLAGFFKRYGVSHDAESYFYSNFIHKMRRSLKPDFDTIFG